MNPVSAFIGLGSNLENPLEQVTLALSELDQIRQTKRIKHSSLYRSDPVGPAGQPDYINAVAQIETSLEPLSLLRELQAIEQAHDRVRKEHWGPRTLDLDLLVYADQQINHPDLIVPHKMIAERSFVLVPLAEIAPDLSIPGLNPLAEMLQNIGSEGLTKLDLFE